MLIRSGSQTLAALLKCSDNMSDLEDRDLDLDRDDEEELQDGDMDEDASQPAEPDEDAEDPSSRRGRGRKSKGGGRGKRLNLVNDFGKSRGFAKDGKKFCAPCGKWLPLSSFPAGSAQCGEDRKAIQKLGCSIQEARAGNMVAGNSHRCQEAEGRCQGLQGHEAPSRQEEEGVRHPSVHRRAQKGRRRCSTMGFLR